jgi:hypothetical protein
LTWTEPAELARGSGVDECWLCDSTDVIYTDVIGCHWCRDHYYDIYLGEPDPGVQD